MRIIAGRAGGRRLQAPPGLATRPLTDRIKQSLFDWLGQDLTGWRVADVCAGSGAFGLEAWSRGASDVHLIEPGRHALPVLRANIAAIGAQVQMHERPFQGVLPRLAGLDLVFADPPFPWFRDEPAVLAELLLLGAAALGPDGRMLVRGEQGEDLPPLPPVLRERQRRRYGRSWVAELAPAPASSPSTGDGHR